MDNFVAIDVETANGEPASICAVAHNSPFDSGCLRATARHYGIQWPDNPFLCTLAASRHLIPRAIISSHSLPYVAQFLGIPFTDHHNALADAEACAKIAMTLL